MNPVALRKDGRTAGGMDRRPTKVCLHKASAQPLAYGPPCARSCVSFPGSAARWTAWLPGPPDSLKTYKENGFIFEEAQGPERLAVSP